MLIHALFTPFLFLAVTSKRLARPKNGSGNLFDLPHHCSHQPRLPTFPLGGKTMADARPRFCKTKVGNVIFLRPAKRVGV